MRLAVGQMSKASMKETMIVEAWPAVWPGTCETGRMTTRASMAAVAMLVMLIDACSSSTPAPSASVAVAAPPLESASAPSAEASCEVNITATGGYEGHVAGSIPAAARRIGDGGRGVSVDVFLDMPQGGVPTRFLFSVFDADGPDGPKGLHALFGEVEPGVASHGWVDGLNPGRATLKSDGSSTTFDLVFVRTAVGPGAHVVGSIECPGLP